VRRRTATRGLLAKVRRLSVFVTPFQARTHTHTHAHVTASFHVRSVVVPLLSMSNSVLLCISTLLESGNHYSKMFDLVDSVGRKLFESISITLVCGTHLPTHPYPLTLHVHVYVILVADECMKTEHPELCTHKLNEMPRWLSSNKMETVKALLSDDPAMLCETHTFAHNAILRIAPNSQLRIFYPCPFTVCASPWEFAPMVQTRPFPLRTLMRS